MNDIHTILIDDEIDGRNTLRNFLTKYCPFVDIVAEAISVSDAIEKIRLHRPQLIFLDINMPGENGFELFKHIPSPSFHVIFITAYDEFALEAIKHNALNYLLKPINIDELISATEKVKKLVDAQVAFQNLETLLSSLNSQDKIRKMTLPISDGFLYVMIKDIIRCEANGNYTWFYFTNREKVLVSKTLGNYEKMLKNEGFIRIHHHHLINIAHVERYQRGKGGIVTMGDKKQIDVSQRKRDDFLHQLVSKS